MQCRNKAVEVELFLTSNLVFFLCSIPSCASRRTFYVHCNPFTSLISPSLSLFSCSFSLEFTTFPHYHSLLPLSLNFPTPFLRLPFTTFLLTTFHCITLSVSFHYVSVITSHPLSFLLVPYIQYTLPFISFPLLVTSDLHQYGTI